MAFLKPDKTEIINGLVLHSKIIPLNAKITKAPDSRHPVGSFFRDQRLLNGNGRPTFLTIHNTGAITVSKSTTMAEQYTRATYPNGNMGTVRPHYYVDETEAWQLIEDNRVSWHALEKANTQSLSIEIIGPTGEDNGAKLAATLLLRHNLKISQMVTHNYWMGQPNYIVKGAAKNCPYFILPNWSKFVAKVQAYMTSFSKDGYVPEPLPPPLSKIDLWAEKNQLKVGSKGKHVEVVQAILMAKDYDVREIDGDYGAVTAAAVKVFQKDQNEVQDGVIGPQTWGAILKQKTESKPTPEPKPEPKPEPPIFTPYKVRITTPNGLNVRKDATTTAAKITTLSTNTIVEISNEKNGWGYSTLYKGWLHLSYTKKV